MIQAKSGPGVALNGRVAMWAVLGALLLLPALAMRFTGEVRWDAADFIVAALILAGVGGGIELACRLTGEARGRAAMIAAVVLAAIIVWVNAAVGIF